MSNVFERMNNIALTKGPLMAGLDPCIDKIVELFFNQERQESGEDLYNFQRRILNMFGDMYITNLKNFVGAVKINPAFYEALKLQSFSTSFLSYAKNPSYHRQETTDQSLFVNKLRIAMLQIRSIFILFGQYRLNTVQ